MTSRDFGYLTLRNTTAYNADDTFIKENYVFTTSSYGKGKWTNSLVLNDLQVSTLEARAIETSSIQISSLIDSDGTTGNSGEVLHTSGSTIYWAPVGAGTGFWTANGNNIYNNNSGNVGISTITPIYNLQVNGSFFASSISSQTLYDVAGQPGSANQVLTAGPSGGSLIWSTVTGGGTTLQNGVSFSDYLTWNNSAWVSGLSTASAIHIGSDAGLTNQGISSIALGNGAGKTSQSTLAIAIGNQAGTTSQDVFTIAIGSLAGNLSQSRGAVAIGAGAGFSSQNKFSIAIGAGAGQNAQGPSSIAIGLEAGLSNQGENSIAIGYAAGNTNQSSNTIVLNASGSALNTLSTNALYVAPIRNSDTTSTLYYNPTTAEVTYGTLASGSSLPSGICFSDYLTWNNSAWVSGLSTTSSVNIGCDAGATGQGLYAIALGNAAGQQNQQLGSIAIGFNAGNNNQSSFSVAIGINAASTSQGINAVAIGSGAGIDSQGVETIAIGNEAGGITQSTQAIAIGTQAGEQSQGQSAIAFGTNAGNQYQSSFAIAIGNDAGYQYQGPSSIAIGLQAGSFNQGENSIAIGTLAGYQTQSTNTIVLNATGIQLDTLSTSSLYIAPIRNTDTTSTLYYDPTTSEVTYGTVPSGPAQKAITSRTGTNPQIAPIAGVIIDFDGVDNIIPAIDISYTAGGTFTFANAGTYQIQLTLNCYETTASTPGELAVWLLKNSTNLVNSTWSQYINNPGNEYSLLSMQWCTSLTAGQTLEIAMASKPTNTITTTNYFSVPPSSPPGGSCATVIITQLV